MGIFFDMPGGGSRIYKTEFRRALSRLLEKHLSHDDINRLEKIFRGDLDEPGSSEGISRDELKRAIRWMKDNRDEHPFSSDKIATIEATLKKYL